MVVFYLLLAVVLALLWICIYVFKICFYSPKNRVEDPYTLIPGEQYEKLGEIILSCTRAIDKTPCTFVSTYAHDGLKLSARYYHTSDDAPTVIVFHGYRGNALRDGAGGFALSKRLGFNVLVPDQRAHAKSEGRIISFGIKERMDVLSWINYVGTGRPIVLAGLSMGAATVLMASNLELPENVVCIMADCPYDSPATIIRKVCTDRKFPEKLVYPFIKLTARLFCGFDLEETSAIEAVRSANIPILLFHGEDDRFVPCEMSKNIAANCASPVQLELFPDAGHGLCYMIDPIRYEQDTIRFLWKITALIPYLEKSEFALQQR